MPSGKIIILDITAIIIPMEIHFIQSKIHEFTFSFVENNTPKNLQRYVAIDATSIADNIFSVIKSLSFCKNKNQLFQKKYLKLIFPNYL